MTAHRCVPVGASGSRLQLAIRDPATDLPSTGPSLLQSGTQAVVADSPSAVFVFFRG